jgi:hypothetical protein
MMWEMYTGYRAYQGKKAGNIIFLVTSGKGKLELPEDAPQEYKVRRRPGFVVSCDFCHAYVFLALVEFQMILVQCFFSLGWLSNFYVLFWSQDIMNSCLDYDPEKRPTFKELGDLLQAHI